MTRIRVLWLCLLALFVCAKADAGAINSGDTAFVLVSAGLVFFMTPGVAFFYGGMVDKRQVLHTVMMCVVCAAIVTLEWTLWGYTMSFGPTSQGVGDGTFSAMHSVRAAPNPVYSPTVPQVVFCFYQLTFAIITPSLIAGALVGRVKFHIWILFVLIWSTLVYNILAHWLWAAWINSDGVLEFGWLRQNGAIDFAGGNVVHISSGFSALVACIILGPREALPKAKRNESPNHSVPFVVLGTAMLWFGWFGFNGGSALQTSDGLAGIAALNSHISAASAFLMWGLLDVLSGKKFGVVGSCIGAVVGLVGITPACGFVTPMASMAIGAITALACYYACKLKGKFGYDDALDVFGCHGVGGFVGSILTGMFATRDINPALVEEGLFYGSRSGTLFAWQWAAAVVSAVYAMAITAGIFGSLRLIGRFVPKLNPILHSEAQISTDINVHGEHPYGEGHHHETPSPSIPMTPPAAGCEDAMSNSDKLNSVVPVVPIANNFMNTSTQATTTPAPSQAPKRE